MPLLEGDGERDREVAAILPAVEAARLEAEDGRIPLGDAGETGCTQLYAGEEPPRVHEGHDAEVGERAAAPEVVRVEGEETDAAHVDGELEEGRRPLQGASVRVLQQHVHGDVQRHGG
eukprot:1430837-Rhodomonas_salina.1